MWRIFIESKIFFFERGERCLEPVSLAYPIRLNRLLDGRLSRLDNPHHLRQTFPLVYPQKTAHPPHNEYAKIRLTTSHPLDLPISLIYFVNQSSIFRIVHVQLLKVRPNRFIREIFFCLLLYISFCKVTNKAHNTRHNIF